MTNRLASEKSPYLLQHKDNPVNWYPWSEEAFEAARREDKPIFLSIGYSTCHWCHVMAHESFEDSEVAKVLEDFICIKVDREERPDIDAIYMDVCLALTGSGGWPLTVIMTPEQKPFFAGTYFPKKAKFGQTGLKDILKQTKLLWDSDRESLINAGEQITQMLSGTKENDPADPSKAMLNEAYKLFSRSFDHNFGGFGGPPKFPSPHNLLFLLRYYQYEKQSNALLMVEKTLDAMARGGIFDHIGGGFSRYSTDRRWLVPHFEKMLYDNALLILAYTEAYQITNNRRYSDVIRRTADYILRELTSPEGGFYCGQDADSDGVEGKYYTFTPDEITKVLGKEKGEKFCLMYGITDNGNFEGKSIPNLIGKSDDAMRADAPELKALYEYRRQKVSLHKDDKILLSWNGWTIAALARAGFALNDTRYLSAAVTAQRFIEKKMADENNRLFHRYRDGESAYPGQVDDYAVYTLALLELYHATMDARYLKQAILRAKQMTDLFEDKTNGGYFIAAHDAERLIARPKELYDGAIPSGNSVAAVVLERIAALTGDIRWQDRADRQLRFISGQAHNYPIGYSFGLLAIADSLYPSQELICTGEKLPSELTEYLRSNPSYNLSVIFKSHENESLLNEIAPFTRDYPISEDTVHYYLCENKSCLAPADDLKSLPIHA